LYLQANAFNFLNADDVILITLISELATGVAFGFFDAAKNGIDADATTAAATFHTFWWSECYSLKQTKE